MLSKNNFSEKSKKTNQERQRFSIRKLTIGAASVLIGLTFMGVSANQKVDAATSETSQGVVESKVVDAKSDATTEQKDNNSNENASIQQTANQQDVNAKADSSAVQNQEDKTTVETTKSDLISEKVDAKADQNQTNTKESAKNSVPNTPSNEAVMKDPAVKGNGQDSNGEKIGNINSKISIEGTNKYDNQTSSSSAKSVDVNGAVVSDLNMVITISNDTEEIQQIGTNGNLIIYTLPAWYGMPGAQIVVDPSRVKTDPNTGVIFGGDYVNSNVSIKYWDVANKDAAGSSGVNDKAETINTIVNDPSLIGGFQIVGSLKAKETVQIIVPIMAKNSQKNASGNFERYFGHQSVSVNINPENFRDANKYTDTSMTVDGLTDDNISNLAETNGDLTLTGQITNNGFISHLEGLTFTLSNTNSTDIHHVQVVLDHSKELKLDWNGANKDDIQYRVNNIYKTYSQMTESDWNNVTAVKVSGNLNSGDTAKVTIPVKLANADQIKNDLQKMSTLGSSSNRNNVISLSATSDGSAVSELNVSKNYYYELPAYSVMDAIKNEIKASGNSTISPDLLVNINGQWRYIKVDGLTFPHLDSNDFIYRNIGHNDPSDPSTTLFTDGTYQIKLDKIFNAIKDQGYSVNINEDGDQQSTWPVYTYQTGTGNKDDKIQLYVQVQQVFDTKNLTLNEGDSWNSNDSLISANVEYYKLDPTGFNGGSRLGGTDLKDHGKYTYDLYDANGNKIAADVPVGQNVPTLAAGVYKVVYHYVINKDQVVSKTATITVKGAPFVPPVPGDGGDKDKPDDSTPVTPVHPGDKPDDNKGDDNKDQTGPVKPQKPFVNKSEKNKNTSISKGESVSNTSVVKADAVTASKSNNAKQENTLPQTGERDQMNTSIFGLLAAVLGIFGLALGRRKKN